MSSKSSRSTTPEKPASFAGIRLDTGSAIKGVATLTEDDFLKLQDLIAMFVKDDTSGVLDMVPRTLTNPAMATLIDDLLEEAGLGEDFWNEGRDEFDAVTGLVYPEDKKLLQVIVFSMVKCEMNKLNRKKRAREDDEDDVPAPRIKRGRPPRNASPSSFAQVPRPTQSTSTMTISRKSTSVNENTAKEQGALKGKANSKDAGNPTTKNRNDRTVASSSKASDNLSSAGQEYVFSDASGEDSSTPFAGQRLNQAFERLRTSNPSGLDVITAINASRVPGLASMVAAPAPHPHSILKSSKPGPATSARQPRAVSEPNETPSSLIQTAALALSTSTQLTVGLPPAPYRSLRFTVVLVSTDDQMSDRLAVETQSFVLKPVSLSYLDFIGHVVLSMKTLKQVVAFAYAAAVKVMTKSAGDHIFGKMDGDAAQIWQDIMAKLVQCGDVEGDYVWVHFLPRGSYDDEEEDEEEV